MSDWDVSQDDDDEDDSIISLEDLENLENEKMNDSPVDEDDWGDSYDDLDSEAWERQYRPEEDEVEKDPWELG